MTAITVNLCASCVSPVFIANFTGKQEKGKEIELYLLSYLLQEVYEIFSMDNNSIA
ncbi:hypothetical protein JYQ62_33530 [Nostoc sp. UHCC 0702]|nr:hypothetical protein JYQ62_33530 [Nostoc sp. UHCC 0702]